MLKSKPSSDIKYFDNINEFKFYLTSMSKTNTQLLKEDKKEKAKRNHTINNKYLSVKNLDELSSDITPRKKKSCNKKGKYVKFQIQEISQEEQHENRTPNSDTTNYSKIFEDLLKKSPKKKKVAKKHLIHLTIPNKLKKEIDLLSLNIVYPVENRYGYFEKYQQNIKESLKQISKLSLNSIFSCDNLRNVNYLFYEGTYDEKGNKKKLLLLDLDETIIHSELRDKNNFHALNQLKDKAKCYHKVFSYIDKNYLYYFDIFFRPYLFDFLHELKNYFDIAIFTASSKGYADTIINYIDPSNTIFKFRLYREACISIQDYVYIKDLRIIRNYDPSNIILIDNSLYSFISQPKNGMLLYSFYWDNKDDQLIRAKNFLLKYICNAKDVREELERWQYYNEFRKNK